LRVESEHDSQLSTLNSQLSTRHENLASHILTQQKLTNLHKNITFS